MITKTILVNSSNVVRLSRRYVLSTEGRIYATDVQLSCIEKIKKIVIWALIFPPLIAYIAKEICSRIVAEPIYTYTPKQPTSPTMGKMLATKDCQETQNWRKQLIRIAKHHIVISGNYCGGEEFNDILREIKTRMREVKELRCVIIAHPKFVTKSNKKFLNTLQQQYGNRFQLIHSPNIEIHSKNSTNHTKCFLIDYGSYFIQGGSAIKDNFSSSGSYFREKKNSPKTQDDISIRPSTPTKNTQTYQDDLALLLAASGVSGSQGPSNSSWVEKFLPSQFRDSDFVCQNKDPQRSVYKELLYLCLKWDNYKKNGNFSEESWDLNQLSHDDPLFTKYPALAPSTLKPAEASQSKEQTALQYLLSKPAPDQFPPTFLSHAFAKRADDASLRFYYTGPEDEKSAWEETLVESISKASHKIAINQMYFQPTERLSDSIIEAATRGVHVEIVTCAGGQFTSTSERFFGHHNVVALDRVFSNVPEDKRNNLHFFAFKQGKNSLHKKICIIDDTVYAGSSNLGLKSLILSGDHEMNFEAQGAKLAKQVVEVFKADKKLSLEITGKKPTLTNHLYTLVHRLGKNQWG